MEKKEEFIIPCLFAFPNGIYRHLVEVKNETLLRRWDFARIPFHEIEKSAGLFTPDKVADSKLSDYVCVLFIILK